METDLPEGVTVQMREDENNRFLFLQNFTNQEQEVLLPEDYFDVLHEEKVSGTICLAPYAYSVLNVKK